MTNTDNKDTQIKAEIASEAYIVLTDAGDAYFIEGNTLHFFDSLSGNMIDAGLVVPEELLVGVYFCTNFHSVNHSYDRDSGVLDGWDVACTWELVWNKQQAAELKQLRAERQWQDISTAPKDGTKILAYLIDNAEHRKSFPENERNGIDIIVWTNHNKGGWISNRFGTPTLWVPLLDKLTDSAQRVTNKEEE